jgi:hypothetical protein
VLFRERYRLEGLAALGRDELTYTFPYAKLMEIADQIKPTAEYINNLYTSLVS